MRPSGRAGARARRKPRLELRFDEWFALRFAARTFRGSLFHEPPRITRSVPR